MQLYYQNTIYVPRPPVSCHVTLIFNFQLFIHILEINLSELLRLKLEADLVTLSYSGLPSGQVLRVSSSVWIIVSTLAMAPIPVSPQTEKF